MSKLGACVDTTLTWIGNNKLATFLGLVAFSLMVSTWTLAAINVNLEKRIEGCEAIIYSTETPPVTTVAGETTKPPETTVKPETTVNPESTTEHTGSERRRRFAGAFK